jgi:hypothetical protein
VLDSLSLIYLRLSCVTGWLHRLNVTINLRIAFTAGHPCYTSRVECSLHPITPPWNTRLIYLGNCRAVPLLKLDSYLTFQHERLRVRNKTLDDSSSLKLCDIIDCLVRGTLRVGKWGINTCQACGGRLRCGGRKVA